jgi:hypothetical protein
MVDSAGIQTAVQRMFRDDIVYVKRLRRKGSVIVEMVSVGLRIYNEILPHASNIEV